MKSLNGPNMNSDIFTPEIIDFIKKEGFEYINNYSYVFNESFIDDHDHENMCFTKYINDLCASIYIFSCGIGIDFDYECGGNSSTRAYSFDYNTFEQAYDSMVDEINSRH